MTQHAPNMSVLSAEILAFMKEVLEKYKDLDRAMLSRSAEMFSMSESARHDMKTIAAIMRHTEEEPLPILRIGIRALARRMIDMEMRHYDAAHKDEDLTKRKTETVGNAKLDYKMFFIETKRREYE